MAETWQDAIVALARLEEKVDTLLRKQADIASEIKALDADTNRRLGSLETRMTALETRASSRLPWPAVAAAIVGIVSVALVVIEVIYRGG